MIHSRAAFEAQLVTGRSLSGEVFQNVSLDGYEREGLDLTATAWHDCSWRGAVYCRLLPLVPFCLVHVGVCEVALIVVQATK